MSLNLGNTIQEIQQVASLLVQVEAFINSPQGQALVADAKNLVSDVKSVIEETKSAAAPVEAPVSTVAPEAAVPSSPSA